MDGHPYIVTVTLPFRDNQSFEIEPGGWVKFSDRVHFKVDGAIQAVGDTSNLGSIVFTAVNPELGWGHIEFDSTLTSNPTSVFKHWIFEYGSAPPAVPYTSGYNCGGALAIRNYNNIIIENCLFHHNRALFDAYYPASGGAIALRNSSPVISQCEFINNNSKYGGGIMCYDNSNPEINRNLFYNNSAMNDGGVLEIWNNCNPYVENNTFVLNSAMSNGGAVDIYDSSNPQFINNIFRENSGNTGNQISVTSNDCNVDFEYNDIEGGEAGIGPYGIGNGVYENNIDADPMFADVLALNYHLSYGSPCIDTGDPTIFDPNGTHSDMGAYYYPVPATPVALAATEVYTNYFTANWQEAFDADEYYLDVAEDENFENIISGNIQVVNATNYTVTVPDLSWALLQGQGK